MRILYFTYDGLTDPLGQSQILPYMTGLSKEGHEIIILSAEKRGVYNTKADKIRSYLVDHNIQWIYIWYTSKPPVLGTLWDILRLRNKVKRIQKEKQIDLVHCRSYIPSLIGFWMKKKFSTKFLFDMRGFWADERIDGKIWNKKNPVFRIIYNFFKKKERSFLNNADRIICLTENGIKEIERWSVSSSVKSRITMIPCCVDTEHFNINNINNDRIKKLKEELKITDSDFILSYLGSVGTWYMLDEMMHFFSRLTIKYPNAKFLFITTEPKEMINKSAEKYKLPLQSIIIVQSSREDVPYYLGLSHVSIFFIKPVYSKKASSPTKQAEVMSMGIPCICNSGVGDTDEIIKSTGAGLLVHHFNDQEYDDVIQKMDHLLKIPKDKIRDAAIEKFSLERGIQQYSEVYKSL